MKDFQYSVDSACENLRMKINVKLMIMVCSLIMCSMIKQYNLITNHIRITLLSVKKKTVSVHKVYFDLLDWFSIEVSFLGPDE